MLGASIGKPVQTAVFCRPHGRGSLEFFVVPFSLQAEFVSFFTPPVFVPIIYITSVSWVSFFPSAWGLMARLPGVASHGSWQPIVQAPRCLSDAVVNVFFCLLARLSG